MHAFMHLCLVQLWILGGGEKTGESIIFFIHCGSLIWVRTIPVKVGIGFDWYSPHLYNYSCQVKFLLIRMRYHSFTKATQVFPYNGHNMVQFLLSMELYKIMSMQVINCSF